MRPWIKLKPRYVEAQWSPLSAKVSFVRIDSADWKLPCDNQSMSSSVFTVSSYILVLRFIEEDGYLLLFLSSVNQVHFLVCLRKGRASSMNWMKTPLSQFLESLFWDAKQPPKVTICKTIMGAFLTMPIGSAIAADILFDAQDVGERFEFHFLFGKCQNPEMMFLRGVFSKLTSFHFFLFTAKSFFVFWFFFW